MSSLPERTIAAVSLALFLLAVGGCGFQPAARQPIPADEQPVCVDSDQPYGALENMLRGALAQAGASVVLDRTKARGIVQIMQTSHKRRVLAIDANGRPIEYAMRYVVSFRMLDRSGRNILPPQTLSLEREYAYSIQVELGASRLENNILGEMQKEATRLIMLRIAAVGRTGSTTPPAAAT